MMVPHQVNCQLKIILFVIDKFKMTIQIGLMRPGRPRTTDNEKELRKGFAKALQDKQAQYDKEWGSVTKLAEKAGVTKQSMASYLEAKTTPTQDTLRRVCINLQIPYLDVKGVKVPIADLPKRKPRAVPQQLPLSLTDAILTVAKEHLEIEVLKKRSGAIDLKVTINFATGSNPLRGRRVKALAG